MVTGCSNTTHEYPPVTSTPVKTNPVDNSPSNTPVEESLRILDVAVFTDSYLGQIKYGVNPDRWKDAEIGKVELTVNTNQATRITCTIEITEDISLLGYTKYTSKSSPNGQYDTVHHINADELCPYVTYKYQVFCTNQQGQQVSSSGTFIPK